DDPLTEYKAASQIHWGTYRRVQVLLIALIDLTRAGAMRVRRTVSPLLKPFLVPWRQSFSNMTARGSQAAKAQRYG
ncbi:MAG: hypothetical protein AAGI88_24840, partial [Pseudomonadota bacterium]